MRVERNERVGCGWRVAGGSCGRRITSGLRLTSRAFCMEGTLLRGRGPAAGSTPNSELFLACCCVRLSAANCISLSAWLVLGAPALANGEGW